MNPSEYIEAIVAAITLIVWLVRLEGKIAHTERLANEAQKDVDVLRTKHEGLDTKIVEQLGAVRESLARLEGRLGIKYEDN
jgi:uncharacterized protein YoxC